MKCLYTILLSQYEFNFRFHFNQIENINDTKFPFCITTSHEKYLSYLLKERIFIIFK